MIKFIKTICFAEVEKLVCKEFPHCTFSKSIGQFGAMIPLVKNLEKACFNAKCVFLAKIHHHCEIKKIGGKNIHLLGRVKIYEKVLSVDVVHSQMCMKSWQQVEVVKFNSLVETSKNTFKTTIV
jgi:hypothetical protein